MMFSLSLELDSPLSVLSALASVPPLLTLVLATGSLGLVDDMLGLGGTEVGAAYMLLTKGFDWEGFGGGLQLGSRSAAGVGRRGAVRRWGGVVGRASYRLSGG